MSSEESLYDVVHARFREAFGEPHAALGSGEQWSLMTKQLYDVPIHVLLNGTADKPGVWVFDPHDRESGIQNTPIAEQRQIADVIRLIQERLELAKKKRDNPGPRARPPER